MLFYIVSFKGKLIVEISEISLSFNEKTFANNIRLLKPTYREGIESYKLPVGKTSEVKEAYKEVIIPFEDESKQIRINMMVRSFNDGLAFRY